MLTLLPVYEPFAGAGLMTVRVRRHCVVTYCSLDSSSSSTSCYLSVNTINTTIEVVLGLTTTGNAVSVMVAFIIVYPLTFALPLNPFSHYLLSLTHLTYTLYSLGVVKSRSILFIITLVIFCSFILVVRQVVYIDSNK